MAHSKRSVNAEVKRNLVTGKSYLVAVSGGLDSTVLLRACHALNNQLRTKLAVAHVDHGLRSDSKDDADFVCRLATELGLPYFQRTLTAPDPMVNLEKWGREQRYRYFREIINEQGFDTILTAHHANDVAETLLLKLLANKELTSINAVGFDGTVVRPLLKVSRSVIMEYAIAHGIDYKTDPSNSSCEFTRNRIRNRVLPVLEAEFGGRIAESLARRAKGINDDLVALDIMAGKVIESRKANNQGSATFGSHAWLAAVKKDLETQPIAIAWRIIEHELRPIIGFPLGRQHSEQLVDFILGASVRLDLGNGLRVMRRGGGMVVETL